MLYHYFANKAGILKAVLSEYAPFANAATIIEAQGDAPLEDVVRESGGVLLAQMHQRRHLVLTMLSEAPSEPELAAMLRASLDGAIGEIAAFLMVRQARGEVRSDVNVRAAAHAFVGALLSRFLISALPPAAAASSSDQATFDDDLAITLCRGLKSETRLR